MTHMNTVARWIRELYKSVKFWLFRIFCSNESFIFLPIFLPFLFNLIMIIFRQLAIFHDTNIQYFFGFTKRLYSDIVKFRFLILNQIGKNAPHKSLRVKHARYFPAICFNHGFFHRRGSFGKIFNIVFI